MAIRIMQSLHSSHIAPQLLDVFQSSEVGGLSSVVEARTFWACFIMDCTINSGTYNPRMLPLSEMQKLKVPRPSNFVDFAFGSDGGMAFANPSIGLGTSGHLDLMQSFEITVTGFDIYAQAMAFIFNNGRCAPHMCTPENCPWVLGSPWSRCRNRLEEWRSNQHQRLHYPRHSVAVHMTLGHGESFVYLNLLYYLR